ncbi:MAG: acetolactate synthase [Clostridia bacterium]|nr:acetolactate synthase [Clostridia bacterium]MBQ9846456.1 acetolactate synthase [Clostridia bacterium]MBQ9958440.1 acetolactate synthase [Clostridia bacterium]
MLVKQISVFIENKKGRLVEIADILAKNEIDISALSLADTDEYGVLRMIVSDPHKAKEVLLETGVVGKVTEALAVAIDDRPGGFAEALHILTDNEIEIKYMYACISHHKGKAIMILSVDDPAAADALIASTKSGDVSPAEIYRMN